MLAEYAVRMSLKNRVEIDAVTGTETYEESRYIDAARSVLESLARESQAAADRAVENRRWASFLHGRAAHVHDYRPADADNLTRREELSLEMVRMLRERQDDTAYLQRVIERARRDAWQEVAGAIEESLDRTGAISAGDPEYESERSERIRQLIAEDLSQLIERAEESGGGTSGS